MSFLGDDEWEWAPRRRRQPSPGNVNEFRRSDHFLNPAAGFTGLHRTRSQGHAPVPIVNVFNDVHQDADLRNSSNSPPYPMAPYPPSPGEASGRGRHRRSSSRLGERLGEELLADELAELALERRLRSRSRGRSDAGALDRGRDYYQWEAEKARQELREIERRRAWEREEERIKADMELKRVKSDAKRRGDEEAAEAEKIRVVQQYEREKAEKAAKAKQAEADLLAKIEREEKEKKAREEREYAEFLEKQRKKKEKEEREAKEKKEEIDEAMRKRLRKIGYREDQIEAMIDEDWAKKNTKTKPQATTTTTTTIDRWQSPRQPVYAKVHRDYLSIETLVYYDIPYEYDRTDTNYIIILREMDKYETDVLFEHTKRLRSGKLLLEAPKKRQEYAWYRTRDRSKSRNGRGKVERMGILEVKR